MTAERVFRLYRAYKFFYSGSYDITKYSGELKSPPLIQQHDRQYFHRIAHKLQDAHIHALFTIGFFFKPKGYVSDFTTPAAYQSALAFAGRAENGEQLITADLYELRKRLAENDLMNWLYAVDGSMPGCVGDIISGTLPLDIAAMVLLIPFPDLGLDWTGYWQTQPDLGLGPHPWIERLQKLDQLLRLHRPGWRMTAHRYAADFWNAFEHHLAPPYQPAPASVF
jgi:hypothetical protein